MRGTISLRLLAIGLIGALTAITHLGSAQTAAIKAEEPANNLKSVHEKLEADKKSIVAQYMELTESEAQRFWPVYEEIQTDLRELDRRLRDLLQSYAADYRSQSLSDEKAKQLLDAWIAIEQDGAKHRGAYAPKVLKVLPPKKAARYLQIENEYRTLVRYDLAATVPLVQ
jgi:hypothetical protein